MISDEELMRLANDNSELKGEVAHLVKLLRAVRSFEVDCSDCCSLGSRRLGKKLDTLISQQLAKCSGNSRVKTRVKPRQCQRKSTGKKSKRLI